MHDNTPDNVEELKSPPIEFDFDSFDFKPVTKGLGFHQEQEKDKKKRSALHSTGYQRPKRDRVTYDRQKRLPVQGPSQGQGFTNAKPLNLKQKPAKPKKTYKVARLGLQCTSFVFDLLLLLGVQFIINTIFLKVSNLSSFEEFIKITWIEQVLFFSFTFLFYFTVLDLVGSPGKKIFDLRVISSVSNKRVRVEQTLIRTAITLLSFLSLGMPLLFDFQGKLSDTKVVENAN